MRVVMVETTNPNAVTPCGTYGNGETQDYRVQVVQAGNDVGITELVDPQASLCEADSQRITVRIKNFGTNTQVNVPISTLIKNGATTIASLNIVCPDTIAAQSDVIYTFQAPFTAVAGVTYTVTSSTHLTGDQDASNDQNSSSITVSTGSSSTSGVAEICGTSASLKANITDSNDVAAWYDSPTAINPVAAGNVTSTTVIPSNKTYYLGLNDIPTKVGPVNKKVFPGGGYNEFAGNFVKFTNTVPVVIKSARLYIGHAGKITFIAADIASYNASTGAISYFPISSTTITVYATTPNPKGGAVDGNNSADTGAVYYLNLPIPITGNHAIIIVCDDSANIFRNNNISSNPYPLAIPGVFAITGNSAINTANPSDTTFYRSYYYFFYNMEIQLANCPAPRVPVVASSATAPVITLSGTTLSSSIASGNQWYRNDSAIAGSTGQTLELTLPGVYTDIVSDKIGCSLKSNAITYTPGGTGIGLTVSPNPSHGIFNIQFYVTESSNTHITVTNALGQLVYSTSYPDVTGGFSQQINAGNLAAGVYFLKVIVGKQTYVRKIVIN
jgi:Secretion system C-terminal sorting domain